MRTMDKKGKDKKGSKDYRTMLVRSLILIRNLKIQGSNPAQC